MARGNNYVPQGSDPAFESPAGDDSGQPNKSGTMDTSGGDTMGGNILPTRPITG
jgi:hypothetical protein